MPLLKKVSPSIQSGLVFLALLLLGAFVAWPTAYADPLTHEGKKPAQRTTVQSEGVKWHGAEGWHSATPSYKGLGIKVGVIDPSFKGFNALMGSELPDRAKQQGQGPMLCCERHFQ